MSTVSKPRLPFPESHLLTSHFVDNCRDPRRILKFDAITRTAHTLNSQSGLFVSINSITHQLFTKRTSSPFYPNLRFRKLRALHVVSASLLRILSPASDRPLVSDSFSFSALNNRPKPFVSTRKNLMAVGGHKLEAILDLHGTSPDKSDGDAPCKEENKDDSSPLVVASFYHFASLPDCQELRNPIKQLCENHLVSGGIILAPEGINGSICGTRESIDGVLCAIRSDPRLSDMRHVESPADVEAQNLHDRIDGQSKFSPLAAGDDAPFRWDHVRVKVKKEIVTLGMPEVNPATLVGKYVKPEDWNALIKDPNTIVVDVRNTYETRIGKFHRAVDPKTISFREFPGWVEKNLIRNSSDLLEDSNDLNLEPGINPPSITERIDNQYAAMEGNQIAENSNMKVAMYCTGGIRCEKATSLLRHKGIEEVYHLEGGILKYLAEIPPEESLWEGECFVFDKRVSVTSKLQPGKYHLCYACKGPVTEEEMSSPYWEDGISCPHCFRSKSEEEKNRARARQEQFDRWGRIGGPHGGRKPSPTRSVAPDS